jgi:hypothetical protein
VCCPTAGECYSDATLGKSAPGAECLATQDNTGKKRIQMRQQWIRATRPDGNTTAIVYGVLAGRSELPWNACNQGYSPLGKGGYIQIIDFNLEDPDINKHVSHVGYAKFVPDNGLQAVLNDGFCYGQEQYAGDEAYRLGPDGMTPSDDYPAGLPKPMPLKDAGGTSTPWTVKPARAKRLPADFDVTADRAELLAYFDTNNPDNIAKDGFNSVFYFDEATGRSHGFSAMSWTIVYAADGSTHLSIPIREVETRSQFNDKDSPNCVGAYRADALDPSAANPCTSTVADNPPWGCKDDSCAVGESPATTKGYFLISELEQIYSADLQVTLCVSYPTQAKMETEGFWNPDTKSCRSATWNPTAAGNAGIPKGDWCAATNSAATATCHDAWRSESFHVYAGAKIQVDATSKEPTYCSF